MQSLRQEGVIVSTYFKQVRGSLERVTERFLFSLREASKGRDDGEISLFSVVIAKLMNLLCSPIVMRPVE